jgi:hypothetical protein
MKMRVPSVVSTISTHYCDDWRNGVGKTGVCSHKTWNLTSLTREAKKSQTTSCVTCVFPHEYKEVNVSMLNLWPNNLYIEKYHEPWDGGGPIWCITLRRKCQR